MQGNFMKILWSDCDLHFHSLHLCLFLWETAAGFMYKIFALLRCHAAVIGR